MLGELEELLLCYFVMVLGRRKRRRKAKGDTSSWKSATTSFDIGRKRRGSGRVATNLTENMNLPLPKHTLLSCMILQLFH
jgi:hypothetical protein